MKKHVMVAILMAGGILAFAGIGKWLVDFVYDPWLMLINAGIVTLAYIVMVLLIITQKRLRRKDEALLDLLGDTTADSFIEKLKELIEEQRNLSHDISDTLEQRIIEMRRITKEAGRIQEKVAPTQETVAEFMSVPPNEGQANVPHATSRTEVETLLGSLKPSVPAGPTLRELTAEDKRQRVYACSDAGMSVNQIARETSIGKGEVKLILSLRKGR